MCVSVVALSLGVMHHLVIRWRGSVYAHLPSSILTGGCLLLLVGCMQRSPIHVRGACSLCVSCMGLSCVSVYGVTCPLSFCTCIPCPIPVYYSFLLFLRARPTSFSLSVCLLLSVLLLVGWSGRPVVAFVSSPVLSSPVTWTHDGILVFLLLFLIFS